MRLLFLTALIATPAFAQAPSTSSTLPSMGTTAGTTSGSTAPNGVQLGRLPAPLGASTSLSERIDAAAGLNSTRAQGGASMPSALRAEGSAYRDSDATGVGAAASAGRPAGTPLGTTDPAAPPR